MPKTPTGTAEDMLFYKSLTERSKTSSSFANTHKNKHWHKVM